MRRFLSRGGAVSAGNAPGDVPREPRFDLRASAHEEARHITFFINWFRYEEARAGRDGMFERHLTAMRNYYRSIKQLVRSLGGEETTGFAVVGANDMIEGMTPAMFLEAAFTESRRMLGLLDSRLIKPSLLPTLAGSALTLLRALPPRKAPPLAPVGRDRTVAA